MAQSPTDISMSDNTSGTGGENSNSASVSASSNGNNKNDKHFIFPPLQKRSRISKALKLSFADWQLELRKQLLADESSIRKYIKENGHTWTDDGGRRFRMIIAYVAINELQNAINFINYIEKDYPGSGGCYFEIAKILIHLKQCKLYNKQYNNVLLNEYYLQVESKNKYVWSLMYNEKYISKAIDEYYGVVDGSEIQAHNIVEQCLNTWKHTFGAKEWLSSKINQIQTKIEPNNNNNNNNHNNINNNHNNNNNNNNNQVLNDNKDVKGILGVNHSYQNYSNTQNYQNNYFNFPTYQNNHINQMSSNDEISPNKMFKTDENESIPPQLPQIPQIPHMSQLSVPSAPSVSTLTGSSVNTNLSASPVRYYNQFGYSNNNNNNGINSINNMNSMNNINNMNNISNLNSISTNTFENYNLPNFEF